MRIRLLLLTLFLATMSVRAQHNLSGSRRSGAYTYVYRLSTAEALALFRSDMNNWEKDARVPADSFRSEAGPAAEARTTREPDSRLPPGDYLFVSAEGSHLQATLKTIGPLRCDLLNSGKLAALTLHNPEGKPITDAMVFSGRRRVGYDSVSNSYLLGVWRKDRSVKVIDRGSLYFFPVESRVYPERHQWLDFLHRDKTQRYYAYGTTVYERKFRSFFILGKPKYKPGDTIRGKAFIMNRHGRPVDRPLSLRLHDDNGKTDTIIGRIIPYRPGGYSFSLVLTDSLRLQLDQSYEVTLEEDGSRKSGRIEKEEDEEYREMAAKRKVLSRVAFGLEEYDLTAIRLKARVDRAENSPGEPVSVFVQATDDNDLPVPDGRVEIRVEAAAAAGGFSESQFHQAAVFIKDTLWDRIQPLDPVGETRIILPDSIFPPASFAYTIHCILLNSDNEYRHESFYQHRLDDTGRIFFTLHGDSLDIDYRVSNHSQPVTANLYGFAAAGETVVFQHVSLPVFLRVSPFVSRYGVSVPIHGRGKDSIWSERSTSDGDNLLNLSFGRTRDSVRVKVTNQHRLFFWYTITAGRRVLLRGYGDSLDYREKQLSPAPCMITLQYRWAGKIRKEKYTVPFREKLLQVEIREPGFVYPGQQTNIGIAVKDALGRPVAGADLTAWSYTAKFGAGGVPGLPYLGKKYGAGRSYTYSLAEKEDPHDEINLNWQRWGHLMGLDTIEYYRFLNPATVYIDREAVTDSMTQIAPFVSRKGQLEAVHLLYIDERPVFFSRAEQLTRYSFRLDPGIHYLRLRTATHELRLDSVLVSRGMKTLICINEDTANKAIHIRAMPDTLTREEQQVLRHSMIRVENNFDGSMALVGQGDNPLYLLNNPPDNGQRVAFLTGPFSFQGARLRVEDRYEQDFEPEGGNSFTISKGLIKEKEWRSPHLFSQRLDQWMPAYDLRDRPLTARTADSLWQDYVDQRSATQDLFINEKTGSAGNGMLEIGLSEQPGSMGGDGKRFIKKIFLFRYDDPDFMCIYKGEARQFGYIPPGFYRMLLLLKGGRYLLRDSMLIRPDGLNFYLIDGMPERAPDAFSLHIAGLLQELERQWTFTNSPGLDEMRSSFSNRYLDDAKFSRRISGRVTDDKGRPLAGASVQLKGTRQGTQTNANGYFELGVTERGSLVAVYVGYNSLAKPLGDEDHYEFRLQPVTMALSEVVVVGYGPSRKKDMVGSVSVVSNENMLMGKVAGLGVRIRGMASIGPDSPPLIIVDGLPYSGELSAIDPNTIGEMKVLKGDAAMAIYGSNGSAGVILITTKKTRSAESSPVAGEAPGHSIRRHFRDDAYWQPELRTDEKGMASFSVRFPDDITTWKTFVIAATDHRQIGFTEGAVRSFKALSAALSTPAFLVAGDSARVIGKVLNYMPDTVTVVRHFSVDAQPAITDRIKLINAHIDTFLLRPVAVEGLPGASPGAVDSMRLSYTLQRADGYFDGEERLIPVYPAGIKETTGTFAVLEGDTSIRLRFDPARGPVSIYASASMLPVMLDEIEHIRQYEYGCNEQLASKLKALLQKKSVYRLQHRDFKEEATIRQLIHRLMQARKGGLWGWWPEGEPSAWITLHVAEALLAAEKGGYTTGLDKQALTDFLVYRLGGGNTLEELLELRLLEEMQAHADYKKYIESIEKNYYRRDLYQTLRLMEVKQAAGFDIRLDTLIPKRSYTALGSCYWGEDNQALFDNSVQITLLMYRLLLRAGGYDDLLKKVRNYLLEQRGTGHWRNTYESCLILETLLPGLEGPDQTITPPSIVLTASGEPGKGGAIKVDSFPYQVRWPASEPLDLHKQGSLPVYFTAYQQYFNPSPEKVSRVFAVHSWFAGNERPVTTLKAGEPVTMQIEVEVKGDADYVMIEAPIPAGCTFLNKIQPYDNQEIHREYFKNKLSIFCGFLRKGKYLFRVSLLPRYTGVYRLNPAHAEMMYFPVIYGREGMRSVVIE